MLTITAVIGILGIISCSNALQGTTYHPDNLWAIAHMTNNKDALDYALDSGANGLHMSLTVNPDGSPTTLYLDDWRCDCVCDSPEMCDFNPCNNSYPVIDVLEHFMQHPLHEQVALIYIDSKLDNVKDMEDAAGKMVAMLSSALLDKGYQGNILIGSTDELYLTNITVNASLTQYQAQIFIGYSEYTMFTTNFKKGLELLDELNYPNKIALAGMPRCGKWAINCKDEVALGRVNKARGVISDIFIWTLDNEDEYERYYEAGARGIITNNIAKLVKWVSQRDISLYAPPGLASLVTDLGDCGCEMNGNGCKIEAKNTVSVAGAACHCTNYMFFCKGNVVACTDINSPYCLKPDNSKESCLQGRGDCNGYEDTTIGF